MAMITCPNCGEQVSDKAKKCVHCGMILIQEEKKKCIEMNVSYKQERPQKVEVTGVKVSKRVKVIIGILVALLLA